LLITFQNIVNRNLVKNKSTDTYVKATTIGELIRFYGKNLYTLLRLGIILHMENTFGNDTKDIRSHFKTIVERFGKVKKLGQRRFEELRRAFNPTIAEIIQLTDILMNNSAKWILFNFF
jgi:hypothetical protein